MKNKGLFLFYLIFWVTGRLYILADTYYLVKIYHSIGLHFDIFCLIAYIIEVSKERSQKLFWKLFLVYETFSIVTFCKVQLSIDQRAAAGAWEAGIKNSGINSIFGNLGFVQDLFIPVFVVCVAYSLHKIAGAKKNV